MAIKATRLMLNLILFSSIFSIVSSRRSSSSIDWWCNRTPHPGTCNYYMRQSNHRFQPNRRSVFRKMLIQLSLDQAFTMQKSVHSYAAKWETKKQETVFSDCVKLYDNTIFHLNRTLQGLRRKRSCSTSDPQTWLSTALRNLETCDENLAIS